MSVKLHCPIGNYRGTMILVAAELAGLPVEHQHVEYTDLKTPEFLKLNPIGKVPVLETAEGPLYESHSILRHIARTTGKLYGANAY